eukprot:m.1109565 g.1109565  ORF g.1109565 m.1109565 type:complete len:64 (+) comp24353_c0_seq14:1218-1409(+)
MCRTFSRATLHVFKFCHAFVSNSNTSHRYSFEHCTAPGTVQKGIRGTGCSATCDILDEFVKHN